MTTKLIIIATLAAMFGWGFSELVEQSDETGRRTPNTPACQEWSGPECAPQFDRSALLSLNQ